MKIITTMLTIIMLTTTVSASSLNKSISNRKQFVVENISRNESATYKDKLNNYNIFSIRQWGRIFKEDRVIFYATYDMTLEEYNAVNRHVKWWVKRNRVRNKREMVLRIRQYLSDNIEYDYTYQDSAYTQYGAYKNKSAVCQGMSLYAKDFFDEAGIGNRMLRTDNHTWNEILLEGRRYEIDFTKECQWDELIKGIRYDIFQLGG